MKIIRFIKALIDYSILIKVPDLNENLKYTCDFYKKIFKILRGYNKTVASSLNKDILNFFTHPLGFPGTIVSELTVGKS